MENCSFLHMPVVFNAKFLWWLGVWSSIRWFALYDSEVECGFLYMQLLTCEKLNLQFLLYTSRKVRALHVGYINSGKESDVSKNPVPVLRVGPYVKYVNVLFQIKEWNKNVAAVDVTNL